ncbi:hypothetical protein APS56_00555 [Pseudalgibacter alginicilyticus]|uniref:DUF4861 domain-containing protein n=1 Tax=Pseudalgibacter alginicilyticus TaxID=1736674 RepID=A0A0P0D7X2_9FLAO|nr:DUF4861 family protein [Pseudalgibacter alginicilyticus]ALJ03731.1 hypothetical protein APS56_00555 [Pseudalgibacter alginicilyticus]
MKNVKSLFFVLAIMSLSACSQKNADKTIVVKNSLDLERTFETVTLTKDFLKVEDLSNLGIKDIETNELQITQTVDNDEDGVFDQLLFQPKVAANSEKKYVVVELADEEKSETIEYCYSRFVPERTDDYAWENNRVAFRVYGPDAQYRAENNLPQPTLSSGVDAWLKRVEYPIINKWYKKDTDKTGSYHKDTGEGLDNFHVGISRGVGGIAVKKDTTYYYSKNYTKWRTITTGPIRTSFYLEYANWDAGGNEIIESKIISLDYGSNLSKFNTTIQGANTISAGLTLHEKDGEVSGSDENAWVSYWQPHADSEIGTAIVAPKKYFSGFEKYDTESKDESNAYAHLKVIDNSVVYYAGFGWKKSKQFNTKDEWESYLNSFSKKIENPLEVTLE